MKEQINEIKNNAGFTLTEVLVGIFLISVVFLGVLGVYQLGIKANGLVQKKIVATYIANQQIEVIKNLPYASIGIKNAGPGQVSGILDAATTTIQNGVAYTIETSVVFVIDVADGIDVDSIPADSCPFDYKRVSVTVSSSGSVMGKINFSTDIAPKNLAQECDTSGGILSVLVFDVFGIPISFPLIEVKDSTTGLIVNSATPENGLYYFPLTNTTTYKVFVSKNGYSSDRSYGINEITTPNKPDPLIISGRLTPISFSIDKVSNFSIDTLSAWGSDDFSDSFLDEVKISEKSNTVVNDGKIELATSGMGYFTSGYIISDVISPVNSIRWDSFSFSDNELLDTNINYQIYYASGTDWYLIPDSDLEGNAVGLNSSPVDLSNLSTTTYNELKLKGNFSSALAIETPTLFNWQVFWVTNDAVFLPNTKFELKGAKTIGKDGEDNFVYKYSILTTTDSSGHKDLQGLEWDFYNFSATSGLNLINIQPSPQPINLPPNNATSVKLYLGAQNSVLLTIEDIGTLDPVFAATVRLYRTGYDLTQYTNSNGQSYFLPLNNATYNVDVSATDYLPTSTTVYVNGNTTKMIKLQIQQ